MKLNEVKELDVSIEFENTCTEGVREFKDRGHYDYKVVY